LGTNVGLRTGARKGAKTAYNNISDDSDDWNNLMRNFLANAFCYADVCAVNVQMLAGNKVELLGLFGEFAQKTIDIAIWSKSTSQPAMAEQVMNSAYEFVWLMSNEERPTRRIKTASFERGCFSNVYTSAGASGHDASIHGAVFPLKVAAHYIGNLSLTGSSVYDPFLGSGTTLIAAEQLGRKCYGMELSPQYCDVIVRRWQTLTGRQATRESDGVTFDQAGQA
jgi:DNA modification methylase